MLCLQELYTQQFVRKTKNTIRQTGLSFSLHRHWNVLLCLAVVDRENASALFLLIDRLIDVTCLVVRIKPVRCFHKVKPCQRERNASWLIFMQIRDCELHNVMKWGVNKAINFPFQDLWKTYYRVYWQVKLGAVLR